MKTKGWLSILIVASFMLTGCYTQLQMVERQSSPRQDMPYYSWDEQSPRTGQLTEADSIYVEGYNDGVYDAQEVYYRDYNRLNWYRNNVSYISDYYGPSFGGGVSYWGPIGYYDPLYPHRVVSLYDSWWYYNDPFFWYDYPYYRSRFYLSFNFGFYGGYHPFWGYSPYSWWSPYSAYGYYGGPGHYNYYTWWYHHGNYTKPVQRDRDYKYGRRASGEIRYPAGTRADRAGDRSRYTGSDSRPGVQRALPNNGDRTRSRYTPSNNSSRSRSGSAIRSTGRGSGKQRATPPSNNTRNVRRQSPSNNGSSPANRSRNVNRSPNRNSSPASNSSGSQRSRNVRRDNSDSDNGRSSLLRSRLDYIRDQRARNVEKPRLVPRNRRSPVIRWNTSSGNSSYSFPKINRSSSSSNRSTPSVKRSSSSSNTRSSSTIRRSSSNTRSSSGSSRSRSSNSRSSGSNRSRN